MTNRQLFRRAVLFATLAILAVALASSVPSKVAAQDDAGGRVCSARTLQGDYGLAGTGTRGLGPAGIEPFVLSAAIYEVIAFAAVEPVVIGASQEGVLAAAAV